MDNRGQSTIIGFALLALILAIGFAQYQATFVPQEDSQAEFQHNQETQNELVDLRNGIINSDVRGESESHSVQLGLEYPNIPLAIDRSATPGYLQYHESEFSINSQICPGEHDTTQIIEYSTDYRHYDSPSYWIEGSLLYSNHDGEFITRSGQQLVSGSTINVRVLTGGENLHGVGSEPIDIYPGRVSEETIEDPVIQVPTYKSEEAWEQTLVGQVEPENIEVDLNELTITPDGEYTVRCSIIGIGEIPSPGERIDEDETVSNPDDADDVRLVSASPDGTGLLSGLLDSDEYELTFEDNHDREFVRGRLVFFNEHSGGPDSVEVWGESEFDSLGGNMSADLEVKGGSKDFGPTIPTSEKVVLKFDGNIHDNEWFLIRLWTDDGTRYEYYVDGDGFSLL